MQFATRVFSAILIILGGGMLIWGYFSTGSSPSNKTPPSPQQAIGEAPQQLPEESWLGYLETGYRNCHIWSPNPNADDIVLWSGACDSGLTDGEGTLIRKWTEDGVDKSIRYNGQMQGGKFNGSGQYVFVNGDRYEGDFTEHQRTGRGIMTFENGESYEGDFVGGVFHGRGVYTSSNGNKFEGNFSTGKRESYGIYTWANGNRYEGDFVDGEMTGQGIAMISNGDRYEGEFVDKKFNGQGVFIGANGQRMEGTFVDGRYVDRQ